MNIDVLDDRRCEVGEGPIWDARTGEVLWVDITGCAIHAQRFADGARRTIDSPTPVGAIVPRADGREGWLAILEEGPALLDNHGSFDPLGTFAEADGFKPETPTRANDAKCDQRGRCWCGTMAYNTGPGKGALYRLDPGTRLPTRALSNVTISNGIGWSADGRTMYFIDTPTQQIFQFDYEPETGTIANRTTLIEIDARNGSPDGMTVDADDCLWVALWGGGAVRRYTPDGKLDRTITFPCAQITSCVFVGPKLDRLAVTSAWYELEHPQQLDGVTFIVDAGVTGTGTDTFGG